VARIVHLAIKVEDLEQSTKFYEDVFGFKQVKTKRNGQHISRHMTDGNIDLALMSWQDENQKDALLAGPGPFRITAGAPFPVRPVTLAHVVEADGFLFCRYLARADAG